MRTLLIAAACLVSALSQNAGLDGLLKLGDGRTHRVSSASPDPNSNGDNLRVKPGETRVLAELTGPGIIRHLWLTFPEARPSWLAKDGGARPDEIVIRFYWDDSTEPAVESPVGDFFAVGFGRRREVRSVPVQVEDGDSYNAFWPMPFRKSAKVTLTNESQKPLNSTYFHLDWEAVAVADDAPYFCAQYRQEFPAVAGRDYLILDAVGRGHYVGCVLSVRSRSPEWFGEGDDCFYIDGEEKPSIRGTGTEDYFLSAWGLKLNSFPYSGTTLLEGGWGHIGQITSAYRWHLNDPVRFQKSLRVTVEHKGWVPGDEKPDGKIHGHTERFDDFATVAFWYQLGQPKRFASLPPAPARVPPVIDVIVDGAALLAGATATNATPSLQAGYDWTPPGQLFVKTESDTAAVDVTFEWTPTDRRAVVLPLTRSYDFGIWRIKLDGEVKVDALDLYAAETHVEEISLGTFAPKPGKHVLRFELAGKNAVSTGRYLGLDSIRLRERQPPR